MPPRGPALHRSRPPFIVRHYFSNDIRISEAAELQSAVSAQAAPRVTIAMIMRERHLMTEAALEAVHRNTGLPYRLIYGDTRIPSWLREILLRRADEWRLEIAEFEDAPWPNGSCNRMGNWSAR